MPYATNHERERRWRHAPHRFRAGGVWFNASLMAVLGVVILILGGWVYGSLYLLMGVTFLWKIATAKSRHNKKVRRMVAQSLHACPACQQPTILDRDILRCTVCDFTLDIPKRHRELQEMARHTSVPDPKREWMPLTVSQMQSPWWLRLLGLSSVIALGAFPIHSVITDRIDESLLILAASGICGVATAIGFAWRSTQKQNYLRSRRFRVCPRCKKPLQSAAAARHDPGTSFNGECPRCGIGYTQEWLELAWSDLKAQRAGAASPSPSPSRPRLSPPPHPAPAPQSETPAR